MTVVVAGAGGRRASLAARTSLVGRLFRTCTASVVLFLVLFQCCFSVALALPDHFWGCIHRGCLLRFAPFGLWRRCGGTVWCSARAGGHDVCTISPCAPTARVPTSLGCTPNPILSPSSPRSTGPTDAVSARRADPQAAAPRPPLAPAAATPSRARPGAGDHRAQRRNAGAAPTRRRPRLRVCACGAPEGGTDGPLHPPPPPPQPPPPPCARQACVAAGRCRRRRRRLHHNRRRGGGGAGTPPPTPSPPPPPPPPPLPLPPPPPPAPPPAAAVRHRPPRRRRRRGRRRRRRRHRRRRRRPRRGAVDGRRRRGRGDPPRAATGMRDAKQKNASVRPRSRHNSPGDARFRRCRGAGLRDSTRYLRRRCLQGKLK